MKVFIGTVLVLLAFTFACAKKETGKQKATQNTGIKDTEIGLRTTSLEDEDTMNRTKVVYSKSAPGTSTKFPRSFDNAPPLIPHSTKGFIPITTGNNTCLSCHMPKFAKAVKSTPIPFSHLYDTRRKKDLKGKLSGARYVCTTCHVQQASNLKPLVGNNFNAIYSSEAMKTSSNLLKK